MGSLLLDALLAVVSAEFSLVVSRVVVDLEKKNLFFTKKLHAAPLLVYGCCEEWMSGNVK